MSDVETALNNAVASMAYTLERQMVTERRRLNRMWEQWLLRDGLTRIRWDVNLFPRARALRRSWLRRYRWACQRIRDTWTVFRQGIPESDW